MESKKAKLKKWYKDHKGLIKAEITRVGWCLFGLGAGCYLGER